MKTLTLTLIATYLLISTAYANETQIRIKEGVEQAENSLSKVSGDWKLLTANKGQCSASISIAIKNSNLIEVKAKDTRKTIFNFTGSGTSYNAFGTTYETLNYFSWPTGRFVYNLTSDSQGYGAWGYETRSRMGAVYGQRYGETITTFSYTKSDVIINPYLNSTSSTFSDCTFVKMN